MKAILTKIPGVLIIEPRVFTDKRGYFFESFAQREFEEQVLQTRFVQDNESASCYGVDIRVGSPTYGQHVAVELNGENHRQLFIPRGFAHGFAVLSERAVFLYKCDNYYAPQSEGGIAWDDPELAIDWSLPREAIILSEKDTRYPTLSQHEPAFDFNSSVY